jgi:glutathione peroxidase
MIRAETLQHQRPAQLYARRRERGPVVTGFPSNGFGARDPGSQKQICDFCRLTCSVGFPMFAKTRVLGPDAAPLYRHLVAVTGGTPRSNVDTDLPDRKGLGVAAFPAHVRLDAPRPVTAIGALR